MKTLVSVPLGQVMSPSPTQCCISVPDSQLPHTSEHSHEQHFACRAGNRWQRVHAVSRGDSSDASEVSHHPSPYSDAHVAVKCGGYRQFSSSRVSNKCLQMQASQDTRMLTPLIEVGVLVAVNPVDEKFER